MLVTGVDAKPGTCLPALRSGAQAKFELRVHTPCAKLRIWNAWQESISENVGDMDAELMRKAQLGQHGSGLPTTRCCGRGLLPSFSLCLSLCLVSLSFLSHMKLTWRT